MKERRTRNVRANIIAHVIAERSQVYILLTCNCVRIKFLSFNIAVVCSDLYCVSKKEMKIQNGGFKMAAISKFKMAAVSVGDSFFHHLNLMLALISRRFVH